MKLTSKQLKAIHWYSQEHHLKPQLSAIPTIYFKTPEGVERAVSLDNIEWDYDAWRKEDQKERTRQRKLDKSR